MTLHLRNICNDGTNNSWVSPLCFSSPSVFIVHSPNLRKQQSYLAIYFKLRIHAEFTCFSIHALFLFQHPLKDTTLHLVAMTPLCPVGYDNFSDFAFYSWAGSSEEYWQGVLQNVPRSWIFVKSKNPSLAQHEPHQCTLVVYPDSKELKKNSQLKSAKKWCANSDKPNGTLQSDRNAFYGDSGFSHYCTSLPLWE